ncbi:Putative ABC transporter [Minicystis rosea]|nr:Putative ABC transporter [Minicystis rosea]
MTSPSLRIVSLLPSSTEICFALDLGDALVGVSHECDFPPEVRGRPVLTAPKVDPHATSAEIDQQVNALAAAGESVYRIDEERLHALAPDLVLTQGVCEVCAVSLDEVEDAVRRSSPGAHVHALSPSTLEDVIDDVVRVGIAAGVPDRGERVATALRGRLARLRAEVATLPKPKVLLLEWLSPPFIGSHWTPEILRIAGGEPVLGRDGVPAAPVAWERIVEAAPDVVIVAPCGFRIEQSLREMSELARHPAFATLPAAQRGRVVLLDGNAFFNRPGPRLVDSAELAALAMHPDHFGGRFPFGAEEIVFWSQRGSTSE